MESEKYLEGDLTQQLPLFKNYNFSEWKNKFENYVKTIDQDLWQIISNGNIQQTKMAFEKQDDYIKIKLDKNTKAKMMIYKALPRDEYERVFLCKTANDIWKNLETFHQENYNAKDEEFDLALVVLQNLIDRHSNVINTCATSSNVFNEGTNDKDHMNQVQKEPIEETWSDTDEEEDHCSVEDDYYPICEESKLDGTQSKVRSKTEHFCYGQFILEFSKLENNFKHLCNLNTKTTSNNKSLNDFERNFEKEIILEDKMSRLESNIEINLECETCQEYKSEIKRLNKRTKVLAKFEESSKSLDYLLGIQKSFEDKTGLGFNSSNSSTTKSKHIKFVKSS